MANRVLLGKRGSDYGLFISKPGKDVTSVGREDLIFSSEDPHSSAVYGLLDVTIANGSSSGSATFSTNPGYIPQVLWVQVDGNDVLGLRWFLSINLWIGQVIVGTQYSCEVTTSGVTITSNQGNVSGAKTFRACVFAIPSS